MSWICINTYTMPSWCKMEMLCVLCVVYIHTFACKACHSLGGDIVYSVYSVAFRMQSQGPSSTTFKAKFPFSFCAHKTTAAISLALSSPFITTTAAAASSTRNAEWNRISLCNYHLSRVTECIRTHIRMPFEALFIIIHNNYPCMFEAYIMHAAHNTF